MQVVRAEDARLLSDVSNVKKSYRALRDVNRDLLSDHSRRAAKAGELAEHLKTLNRAIHAAAKLRVGSAQEACLAAARAAVQAEDAARLVRALREGV